MIPGERVGSGVGGGGLALARAEGAGEAGGASVARSCGPNIEMRIDLLGWIVLVTVTGCAPGSQGERPVETPEAPARVAGAPLVFTTPAGWTEEEPTSSMRKAQYRLARAQGDGEDGECVVYFFGAGGGGGVEANLERCARSSSSRTGAIHARGSCARSARSAG